MMAPFIEFNQKEGLIPRSLLQGVSLENYRHNWTDKYGNAG